MRIARSIFVGSLAALVVAAPALAKNSNGEKTDDKPASASCKAYQKATDGFMDAIALRRGGRKGIAEEHHARHRPTNAVSPGRAKVSISRLLITDSA